MFSKSDYFVFNKFKSISNIYLHPITNFLVAPLKIVSNLQTQFYEFRNLKAENNILKEEIMRLKKWQILANWLLKKDGHWREKFTSKQGFLSKITLKKLPKELAENIQILQQQQHLL